MFKALIAAEEDIRNGEGYEMTRVKHKIDSNPKAARMFKLYCFRVGAI